LPLESRRPAALQPRATYQLHAADDLRNARPKTRLHELRGTLEPHDADVDATVYQADERLLENARNHAAMVALYFMFYNFGLVHQALRVTPAMEAGISDHVWAIEEIIALL
jgi:hypothetical protein